MAATGKFALRDYLLQTREKLATANPSAEELKSKIMPVVSNNVRTKSGGAPQTVRDGLKKAFFDSGVLPSFEADLASFKSAVESCLDVLRDAGIEGIPPRQEVVEEEAVECDDDVFAMMGGMGEGDDRIKCEDPAAAADVDEDDVFAMMGGMGEGDDRIKTDSAVPEEAAKPVAKKGSQELVDAIDGFLDKLDASPPPPAVLKSKAMPHIVNTVKAKSAMAPQELRLKFKAIFEENGVLPDFSADIADLKQALIQIQVAVR